MRFRCLWLVLLVALSLMSISRVMGQTEPPPPGAPPYGDYKDHLPGLDDPKYSRPRFDPWTFGPSPEPSIIKKGLLAPSIDDRTATAQFMRRFDTGLIKLLPREVFDWRTYHTKKRINIHGGGAYFSFLYKSHEARYGSDIELEYGMLSVGFAGADYGFLTNLGDLSLNDIPVDDHRLTFVENYEAARNDPEVRCEFKRFAEGLNVDGALYKRTLPVQVNSTYLLRSITYGRSDLLVAFRVTRQAPDGSVILAWRILKTHRKPGFEQVLYVKQPEYKCPIK